jgi:DNA-binding NtrC family response regulator
MKQSKGTVLVVDDEESICLTFQKFLEAENYTVLLARDYHTALTHFNNEDVELIFLDIVLGKDNGIELLKNISKHQSDVPVVMITGNPRIETASEAIRYHAYDYLTKPVRKTDLLNVTRKGLSYYRLLREKKQVELENKQIRNHLEMVFQNIQEGIVTFDNNLQITSANHKAEQFLDIQDLSKAIQTRNYLLHPLMATALDPLKQTLLSGKAFLQIPCTYQSPDGQWYSYKLGVIPLCDDKKQQVGAMLIIRNYSDLVALENELLNRHSFYGIVGKSAEMQWIYQMVEQLSNVDTTVLITGESGTGKEIIANAIHAAGNRKDAPFIAVNCAAIPENLLESELFGYVKGAFTGADTDRKGRFLAAEGGTLFLDEIGDMPLSLQAKLLRVLQDKQVEPLGSHKTIPINVRIIAATHSNLAQLVAEGRFRRDLFYRLNVMQLNIPPLHQRKEDIPLLVMHFCKFYSKKFDKYIRGVEPEVMNFFLGYSWPGNIRQLKHVLEYAFIVCKSDLIQMQHLPESILRTKNQPTHTPDSQLEIITEHKIREALEKTGGNKARAAKLLGISRQTIYRKLPK